jgi:phospholipid-binding lipoprotein MlaA
MRSNNRTGHFLLLLTVVLLLQACASRSPYEEVSDPLEPVNRVIYTFNDKLDRAVLKPAAKGYQKVLPKSVQSGVRNFFNNIYEPLTIINNILQGQPTHTFSNTTRFIFNTVFGIGGIMDVASDWDLPHNQEDFGQTFGVWGFGEGWYLVLPVLGPSSVRDSAGLATTFLLNLDPIARYTEGYTKLAVYGLYFISERADLLSASKVLDAAALDPYLQVRESYRQKRWYDQHDGNPPEPDFFDDELLDE